MAVQVHETTVRESDAALHPAILRLADTWPAGSPPFRLMLILHRIGYHARCPELARRIELMRGLYPSEVAELQYQCYSGREANGGGSEGGGSTCHGCPHRHMLLKAISAPTTIGRKRPRTSMDDSPTEALEPQPTHPVSATRDAGSRDGYLPFSQCRVWQTQKKFYDRKGIEAFSDGDVPMEISSNVRIARFYGDLILALAKDMAAVDLQVIDLGSGHCQLGWHLASYLRVKLGDGEGVEGSCGDSGDGAVGLGSAAGRLNVSVVMTDYNRDLLTSRSQLKCFKGPEGREMITNPFRNLTPLTPLSPVVRFPRAGWWACGRRLRRPRARRQRARFVGARGGPCHRRQQNARHVADPENKRRPRTGGRACFRNSGYAERRDTPVPSHQ